MYRVYGPEARSNVAHCVSMPLKILELSLKVSVANKQNPCLSGAASAVTDHLPRVSTSWAEIMVAESPDMTPLFDGLLTHEDGELGDEVADGDANSDLLDLDMDDERRKSIPPSRPNSPDHLAQTIRPLLLKTTCTRCTNEPQRSWA